VGVGVIDAGAVWLLRVRKIWNIVGEIRERIVEE
jgi:hypothetical protein